MTWIHELHVQAQALNFWPNMAKSILLTLHDKELDELGNHKRAR